VPDAQLEHEVDPEAANVPAAQLRSDVQLVAPEVDVAPVEQVVHPDELLDAE